MTGNIRNTADTIKTVFQLFISTLLLGSSPLTNVRASLPLLRILHRPQDVETAGE
jgi:hypothetical protein